MSGSSFEDAGTAVFGPDTLESYRNATSLAIAALQSGYFGSNTPFSGRTPDEIHEDVAETEPFPSAGQSLEAVLERVSSLVCADSVGVYHPQSMAHLHCPPTVPALAAELIVSAMNQSMDSWDQSPAATAVESTLIEGLTSVCGLGAGADGVFTSGSTEANVLGLLLARNWAVADRFDHDAQRSGLPTAAQSLRILCSAEAHFTARQAAGQLGLGDDAVVGIPTDDDHQLSIEALESTIDRLIDDSLEPFALIGTAGTTDFGRIDPLDRLGAVAAEHDLWFHVDGAYGGPLVFSDRHRDRLSGIERADSIAMDFHKLCQQPLSCGVFLLADGEQYDSIDRSAAYLNPDDTGAESSHHLVSKSLQTSRRFDALKPYVTFQTLGTDTMGAGIDSLLKLATDTATLIEANDSLELAARPSLSTVVFRYDPPSNDDATDTTTDRIRDRLRADGTAMLARTAVDGSPHLKFTFVNPRTSLDDVIEVLDAVVAAGRAITESTQSTS
ncbi:pyridoxal phosphate-dependent decarboxylase family protein [Halocatena halophila]|uniref:pyridoxal phosphate-dependent decarboxylase family protein n=1 Tax=Halocatena halophila TaxID=2814576 RepID=UPI002ED4DEC1